MTKTDNQLADLAAKLRAAGRPNAAAMVAPGGLADWCGSCLGDGPLRQWPLIPHPLRLCGTCWTSRARGEIVTTWRGATCEISSTHPQHGPLYRGCIRSVGIEARELRPSMVWRVGDFDHHDLGEHGVDFVDALRLLLDATAAMDEIDTDQAGDSA